MSARVEELLGQLTLEEQVSLLAGSNLWHTVPIERLGIPRLRVSDGPAGVRGTRIGGPESMNVPCGTALAATWNPSRVREIGELLGRELLAKGARVHLAPTVNLHRTPVGGRNFECMSEDPLLTAVMAVEYVRGVQSQGVASCIKHFVGNDTEFERMTIDSQIDERTLRELYLVPFERAVSDAGVLSVMSSYNRINGPYAADSDWLLRDVLRGEWGFDGLVMSDWFGLHSTVEAVNAGLDLEMPGPTLHRGDALLAAVRDGAVSADVVRERARNVLVLMERVGALDAPPGPETTREDEADYALIRRASAESMVLVRNERAALPLVASDTVSLAVIGPNSATGRIMGGGSAYVSAVRVSHPLDALQSRLRSAGIQISHAQGCDINRTVPELDARWVRDAVLEYFDDPADAGDPAVRPALTETPGSFRWVWVSDPLGRRGSKFAFGAVVHVTFVPDETGDWTFGVQSVGTVHVTVDDAPLLDNADAPRGGSFFGTGRAETTASVHLDAGREYALRVELRHTAAGMGLGGLVIGARPPVGPDLIGEAVDLAARCDTSIVVVGTNDDWESEGWDRSDIGLPGRQDELVREVAKVSRRTIVVVNAGSPVAMPWLDDVDAVVVAWFAGQEMGEALTDVLLGEVEPSGRLPVTFPRRMEDTPAFEHHPGRNGAAKYLEGRLMGYRWYDTVGRDPLFPFGFGLGYSEVTIDAASMSGTHAVDVVLTNSSARDGVQVVQVYARMLNRADLPSDEPVQRLVGFARVGVPGGVTMGATVTLDRDAYRAWNADTGSWTTWSGDVELRVGYSSRQTAHALHISLP